MLTNTRFLLSVVTAITISHDFASAQISADPTFGASGMVRTGTATNTESWNHLAVQPDGKIVTVGATASSAGTGSRNFLIGRFLSTGVPDPTFNSTGTIEVDFGVTRFDSATSVAILPDGKILVAGESLQQNTVTTSQGTTTGPYSDIALVRLNSNGTIDSTFGVNGLVRVDLSNGLDDSAARLLVLPSGAFRVAGNFSTNPGNRNVTNWAVTGFNSNGSIDPTFGTAGRVRVVFDANQLSSFAYDAILNNGQIVVAGTSGGNMVAARLDANSGALDPTFGAAGIATIAFPPAPGSPAGVETTQATSIALQADGKILLAGDGVFFDFNLDSFSNPQLFATRLNNNGQPDPTFNSFPAYQLQGERPSIALLNDQLLLADGGSILAAGASRLYTFSSVGASVGSPTLQSATIARIAAYPGSLLVAAGRISGDASLARYSTNGAVTPPPGPAAPSNLAATLVQASAVTLSWRDNSSNETNFIVERSASSNFASPVSLATLGANTTTFTDRTVAGRTTYYYRVTSRNANGSAASSILPVTTPRR